MKNLFCILLLAILPVVARANPFGASATYFNAATTATLVVAQNTSGNLAYWNMANPNTGLVYVQFFDAATTGGITLGVTAPKFALAVPPGNGVTDGLATPGITFKNGIIIAVTTTPTGSTAPSTAVPITLATN